MADLRARKDWMGWLGTIYAVGTEDGELVKIGFTTQWSRRRRVLARDWYYHYPRKVLGLAMGTLQDERRLHAQLAEHSACFKQAVEVYTPDALSHPAAVAMFGAGEIKTVLRKPKTKAKASKRARAG